MKTCIIFNPTARGDKARRFQKHLDGLAARVTFKPTLSAGGARPLAAEAAREGFETIVAAGGDGTVNEVLNGIGDVPDAFSRVRLAVLPLGTVNVFAYELGIPSNLSAACKVLESKRERLVDLPQIDFLQTGARRLFTQMAGFGWDARAVQLVDWPLKKKIGRFAYVWAALKAATERMPQITVSDGTSSVTGPFVIVGNGRFYAGRWSLCPEAAWDDGLLEVTVFPRTTWGALLRSGAAVIVNRLRSLGGVQLLRAPVLEFTSPDPAPIQADGEYVGTTPARCSLRPRTLRIVVP
ncbi:MAG TPA: diacylglycerol kinase family protein [Verrucomicrobiae bacterium]|nr:diacylglycerol kinase family protein [Verrucomicrobiae bacterium]